MTQERTRPSGQTRLYGVLVGTIKAGREDAGRSPHYEILVAAGSNYRIAVNVKSVDGSDVIATFDDVYQPPAALDLSTYASGGPGFRAVTTGPAGAGLDYIRTAGLVDLSAMTPIPPTGPGATLGPLFDAATSKAIADTEAVVVAFGQFFADQGRDETFGFSPEQGVHDIHLMQGNPSDAAFSSDNVVHGDGALFIRYGSGSTTAFFSRFSTQSINTDPVSGAPAVT